jgi:hypothetical protein
MHRKAHKPGQCSSPAPALGWQGRERRALTDRVRPDIVLCIALVHYLAIASNVPHDVY